MITIRPAVAEDRSRIWDLLEPVFRAGDTYAVDPRISRDDAIGYWLDAPRATYVAETPDGIVGTYYIKTNQPGGGDHVCNCGYIVDPAARGQGIAQAMCAHSQDQARGFGYRAMQFNFVLSSNAGAVRLWQRLGFAIVGTIPAAFRHPALGLVDAHVMHKTL
ncbi:GNAT family N-acetyltransferase [Yoonia sp.]|uniref:GNAT family N-acetyltransferase n=1 Tax=Yoonia sp. TaxID=2212373 RepID=UPI002FDB43AB